MATPREADDQRTDLFLSVIRRNTKDGTVDPEFGALVEGALTEGLAGRYDRSYPPPGHTYPGP